MQQDNTDPTGVSGEGGPGLIRARERKANAAIQLYLAGAQWYEIAEILGYPTAHAARVAIENALERELKTPRSQAHLREVASRRLDRVLRSTWGKANDASHPDHLAAVGKVVNIIDRHARLWGLDAPAEVVIHSPSANELEHWVTGVLNKDVPALEEGNIFDAEIIDEEEDVDDESA